MVISDDWKGYSDLARHGADHCPIVQCDSKNAATLLPWSHIVFSNLKGWLRGVFHGVSPKHLARYLQEFVYRTNRRWLQADLFFYVLRRAVNGAPLTWLRLIAEGSE